MSGTVTVSHTADWLTPFEVEVRRDGATEGNVFRFAAASRAQTYAVALADANPDYSLIYRDLRDVSRDPMKVESREQPRTVSLEEFHARIHRVCKGKCRRAKPLNRYRVLYHVNRHTNAGRRVPHGWADACLDCEEAE